MFTTAKNPALNSLVVSEAHKPQSKLRVLAKHFLDRTIQCKEVHDPEEDAFASLGLFLKYRNHFEESPESLHVTYILRDSSTCLSEFVNLL